MTAHKHLKQLIRTRMSVTGEDYSTARRRVLAAQTDIRLSDPIVVDVHGRHGQSVAFTPDGTRLLSGGQDTRIVVLDPASGRPEGEMLGHTKVVNGLSVPPDGARVVSVSSDRTARIWDLASRRCVAVLEGHRDAVVALDVSQTEEEAVTGGYDGRLLVWDLVSHSVRTEFPSQARRVAALAYTPDGELFAESGQGPTVFVRDRASGEVVTRLETGSPGVVGMAVAPDGSLLATAGYDGQVILWDCGTWKPLRRLPAGRRANAVTFSRSGRLLAAAVEKQVLVWDHTQDEPVDGTDLPIKGVYDLAMSPDGRRLAQTGADGKVRIWTLR